MPDKAIEKLEGEKKDLDENGKIVTDYLIGRCREDPSMAEDVCHEKKKMSGCMQFIRDKARKLATKGVAMVKDSQVYEWAEDYFRQDPAKMNDVTKEAPEGKAADKPSAGSKATKAPEKPRKSPVKAAKAADGIKEPEQEKTPAAKAEKPRKAQRSSEIEGQMSLFDFMGA